MEALLQPQSCMPPWPRPAPALCGAFPAAPQGQFRASEGMRVRARAACSPWDRPLPQHTN